MIPRYQRILFWILGGAIILMALVLLRGCEQAREKLTRQRDETPLGAPVATPSETVRLALANDADGSIAVVEREVPLPVEPTARARALLTRLVAEYSYKDSAHPIESGAAVDDVFLLDLPLHPPVAAGTRPANGMKTSARPDHSSSARASAGDVSPVSDDLTSQSRAPGGELAIVNLHGTFADHHPSGVEPETLTIESIVGTLYANFPRIEEVRFVVDGRPRETLNGHADLMRTYPVVNTATSPAGQEGR